MEDWFARGTVGSSSVVVIVVVDWEIIEDGDEDGIVLVEEDDDGLGRGSGGGKCAALGLVDVFACFLGSGDNSWHPKCSQMRRVCRCTGCVKSNPMARQYTESNSMHSQFPCSFLRRL